MSTNHLARNALLSQGYEERFGLFIGPKCPAIVREALGLERPLHLVARESGQRSTNVNHSVARDAYEAADKLYEKVDIVAHHALPTKAALAGLIERSEDAVVALDYDSGAEFTTVTASLDMRPQGIALFLTLTAGSGSKLDSTTQHSPAVLNLSRDMTLSKPALLFAKRQDRFFRQSYGQGPFWGAIGRLKKQGLDVPVGDGTKGLWSEGVFARAEALIKGEEDRLRATEILATTRRSMVGHTGTDVHMTDGWIPYHLPSRLLPGFTRVRLIGPHPTGSIKRVYIDTPSNLPDQSEMTTVLPQPRGADGNLADQVVTLRWYFAHAGTPTWSRVKDLSLELVRRGFASDPVRRKGPNATCTLRQAQALQESIWANLDLYETGTWTRTFEEHNVNFSNLFPPDGKGWATAEDFARIRLWRAKALERSSMRATATFGGLRGTCGGRPVKLVRELDPNPGHPQQARVRYLFEVPRGVATTKPLARAHVWLEHDWIAQAVLEALRSAQHVPVPRYFGDDSDPDVLRLRAELQQLETDRAALTANIDMATFSVNELIPGTTEHVMTPQARRSTWERIDNLNAKLNGATNKQHETDRELADRLARQREMRRGIDAGRLADLLLSLLNPHDITYQQMWKSAIHDLRISWKHVRRSGVFGKEVSFQFRLHLSDGEQSVALLATGTHELGSAADVPKRARLMLQGLRAGTPVDPGQRLTQQMLTLRYLRTNILACTDGRTAILRCRQPDLLRLGMAVLFPQSTLEDALETVRTDVDLTRVFSNPAALAERLLRVYPPLHSTHHGWTIKISKHETHALSVAAINSGFVAADAFTGTQFHTFRHMLRDFRPTLWQDQGHSVTLTPCPHCGSHAQAALSCRDVDGYLCLQCRHDRAGVTWPAEQFDFLIAMPQLWTRLGWTFHPEPVVSDASRQLGHVNRRRYRSIADLSQTELDALRSDAAKLYPIIRLSVMHALSERDVRTVLGTS